MKNKHDLSFLDSKKTKISTIINWIKKDCVCTSCKKTRHYKDLFELELIEFDDLNFNKIQLTSTMKQSIINELHYYFLKKKLFKL
tara:strand:- start:267 stop:521 length:255 start_codon:yes stop_codon:yes gene_type:complete